ncbi:MAG: lipid A deacylase LpxR family protein [Bacteroidales bacterium]|nr:lipid A deacylase LpxR family protein [Lentimicrobiaceae bacterium]MDD5695245.1 lipid A deacylase LpxR family protein [Bacteroidales bacterium]
MYRTIILSVFIIGLSIASGCCHPDRNHSSGNGETGESRQTRTSKGLSDSRYLPETDTAVTIPNHHTSGGDTPAKGKIKKKKTKTIEPSQAFSEEKIHERIQTIRRLKSLENELDIGSYRIPPTSRNELEKSLNEGLYLVNPNGYFCIDFDNDIFTNTDRYYTSGIRFDWVNPLLNRSFMTKLMIPLYHPARNYYGLSLVHRMYTPWDPHIDSITRGDRPFSSYLYLGFFKVSNSLGKRYRQQSGFNAGIIGTAALGKQIQEVIHFSEINGWQHQVSNDIILDYHFHTEAGLIKGKSLEIGAFADANAGTLYDRIGIGPYLIAGKYDRISLDQIAEETWGQINPTSGKIQFFLYYRFKTTLVGYDATLQGGMFSENEYTLKADQIKRITFDHCLGLVLSFRQISVLAEYTWLSPEYKGCDPHAWVRCNMTFTL